jgi:hypothetical protein
VFVAGHFGIEQERAAVGNDAGRMTLVRGPEAVEQLLRKGRRLAFITAAQDGDLAAAFGEFTREEFHHGRLAGPADGQVADADHQAAEGVNGAEARLEPPQPPAHREPVDAGKKQQEKAKDPRAKTPAPLQDDIDGELLESIKAVGGAGHGKRS